MPKVTVAVPHHIDPTLVKAHAGRLVEAKLKEMTDVHGFQIQWTDQVGTFQFKVFRLSIRGAVDIQPEQIIVHVDLPLVAAMFKSRVRDGITEGITQALEGSAP